MAASGVRSAAIQPYLVSPAEAHSTRTRVAVLLPDGVDGTVLDSWLTMSRDIDLVSNPGPNREVDVLITTLNPGNPDAQNGARPEDVTLGGARIIVVGQPATDEELVDAARYGAWAYCSLDSPPQELTAIVRRVHAGECPLLTEISRRPGAARAALAMLGESGNGAPGTAGKTGLESGLPTDSQPSPLKKREKEIVIAVSEGASSREIAEKLGLTDQTVRNYMTTLLQRIGANSRSHAVALALRNGWLDG